MFKTCAGLGNWWVLPTSVECTWFLIFCNIIYLEFSSEGHCKVGGYAARVGGEQLRNIFDKNYYNWVDYMVCTNVYYG